MRSVLFFIGSAIYSVIASWLFFVVYRLYAPKLVSLFVWNAADGRVFGLGGALAAFLVFLGFIPLVWLCKNKACKIVSTIPLVLFGLFAVAEPWFRTMTGSQNNFVAVLLSIIAAAFFTWVIWLLWTFSKDNERPVELQVKMKPPQESASKTPWQRVYENGDKVQIVDGEGNIIEGEVTQTHPGGVFIVEFEGGQKAYTQEQLNELERKAKTPSTDGTQIKTY